MHHEFALLLNLSVSLVVALVFGLFTQYLRLSPIVGYLVAGIVIGPQTPGFVADAKMAREFAEIGVVLLMFGVGLHFHLRDLLAVGKIAVPGAVGQILVATTLGAVAASAFGWSWTAGVVIGLAISVASTVVLIRMLMDRDLLHSTQGHIAVGWLIVEDLFTVLVLVVLPGIAGLLVPAANGGEGPLMALLGTVGKIGVLGLLFVTVGKTAIPWLLRRVARTRSRELFTLAVLSLALAIATGSAIFFGVSMALGAFLAGTLVGQTEVSHQAAADALPMRDAFAVLFFVSVGMLFDPQPLLDQPGLLLGLLAVILVAKPLAALLIVWLLGYSIRTAITVAIALAQIGEFSFLLADEAVGFGLLPPEGRTLLVACALVSITVNPILFRTIDPLERWLRSRERIWRFLSRRSAVRGAESGLLGLSVRGDDEGEAATRAVVVGYGPVGRTAVRVFRKFGIEPTVVELNPDTVRQLIAAGQRAVYGDATRRDLLEAAGIRTSQYLLVSIPDVLSRTVIILAAKDLNPQVTVFSRARYLQERAWLEEVGADGVCIEESEMAKGLAAQILHRLGANAEAIREEIERIQAELEGPGADAGPRRF